MTARTTTLLRALLTGDVPSVRDLIARHPGLLTTTLVPPPGRLALPPLDPLDLVCQGPAHGLPLGGRAADLARVLLDAGAPVQGTNPELTTPLHTAASLDALEVLRVLIAADADLEARAPGPGLPIGTPLDHAAALGKTRAVDLLVANGAHVGSLRTAAGVGLSLDLHLPATDQELREALRTAVVCDRVQVFERLRPLVPDWATVEVGGLPLLHWAAWEARPRLLTLLLQLGADPHQGDLTHGGTPALWAATRLEQLGPEAGHDAVLRLLTRAGAGLPF